MRVLLAYSYSYTVCIVVAMVHQYPHELQDGHDEVALCPAILLHLIGRVDHDLGSLIAGCSCLQPMDGQFAQEELQALEQT